MNFVSQTAVIARNELTDYSPYLSLNNLRTNKVNSRLLPSATVVAEACVKNSVGGHVWQGGCVWQGGMLGGGGVHGGGHAWRGGMHGRVGGHVWLGGGMHGRRDGHCNIRYASYFNAFLFLNNLKTNKVNSQLSLNDLGI